MSTTNIKSQNPSPRVVQYAWEDFSPISPYLGVDMMYDRNPWREQDIYNRRYATTQTREPLSDSMMHLLRRELADIFYERSTIELRAMDSFKFKWWDNGSSPSITQFEQLHAPKISVKNPTNYTEYLNKQVIVYFQGNDNRVCDLDLDSRPFETRFIGRYIFREWYHFNHGRPPFQRHRFFAKAIRFPKASPRAPRNIPQVLSFHRSLCRRVSDRLDDLVELQTKPGVPHSWPRPSQGPKTWKQHGFDLGHLFRAVIVVVDDQSRIECNNSCPLSELPNETWQKFRLRRIAYKTSHLSVLLVKTGDDAHLSSPVDFQPLRESGEALELNRADIEEYSEGVVCVTLQSALRFLFDLLRREEDALAHLRAEREELEDERDRGCERWVNRVLSHAQDVGIDTNGWTWQGIRRAWARMNGEGFDAVAQLVPYWEDLDSWE
ncbi:hypothetical protein GQX73_g1774 [Xylaria multiplex]|uniref:Uncharacterized protein n=1 Tax=Xylaria multiplex TaxID=323545 RepID=A0A7C8MW33_9PEZI|nr:hypothetical protein GQX73_g1774 [Xylaria multiplex]